MKQKRKVKSLISSQGGSNVFFATILLLVGGVLFLGAVALFTSLGGVASAAESNFEYVGIDDKKEVLLDLKFARYGGSNTVNNMFLTGNNFYMKGNAGISLEGDDAKIDGYANYLGGDSSSKMINLASDNVTVIGGNGVKVYQGNNNATSLGGDGTKVSSGNNNVAPVIVGGTDNVIGEYQKGNAIVGGTNNVISDNGTYDFIIGGTNNVVAGNNVIVGGKKVNVSGKSNLFVFSDGDITFTPGGSRAFYLKVANGLGLNRSSDNKGVASSGSVSFGTVNIISQRCGSEDIGVQGTWLGCLVGCTQKGADDPQKKWEMIDHGDVCEKNCRDNSNYCMIDPIEPEKPKDYTSYCTDEGVITDNADHCTEDSLGVYENVIFETYLIDSTQECPENNQNKCVFRCKKGYHLGRETSGTDGTNTGRRKCYKNCLIPWNQQEIQHNDTIEAYNTNSVTCSNYTYVFPKSTAIVNVPTVYYNKTWDSASQMYKATRGDLDGYGHSPETCTNFDHKKTLVCNDGTLYIAKDNGTPTTTPAIGVTGAKYIYSGCTLGNFTCSTIEGYYNLTKTDLNSLDEQGVTYKDQYDRSLVDERRAQGKRGIYEVCVDYVADAGNNSSCRVANSNTSYHYKLVKCKNGYSTGTDSDVSPYKCMRGCNLKDRNNKNVRYAHNTTLTGYKAPTKTCTSVCEAAAITCNDGKWVMGSSKNGTTNNTAYLYNDCYLNNKTCNTTTYNVTQTEWNSHHEHGIYNYCDPYTSSDHKFICTQQSRRYDLVGCDEGYHTDNTTASRNNPKSWNKWCISNYRTDYCSNSSKPANSQWDTRNYDKYEWAGTAYNNGSWTHTEGDYCAWKCSNGYHLQGSSSCVDNSRVVNCSDYVNKPTYASWDGDGTGIQGWQGTWDDGDWGPVEGCGWHCNEGYQSSGSGGCEAIYCTQSGGPTNSYYINTNVQISSPAPCDWACNCGYYKNGSSCSSCSAGTYSTAGSNSCSSCPSGQEPNSTQCGCEAEDTYTCSAGEYLPANSTTCDECPCGYYCEGGDFPKRSYDQGKHGCASDKYSTAGSSSCSSCSTGQQPNSSQCSCETIPDDSIHCDAGEYLKKNATTCSQCPCGYYCSGGEWSKSTTEDQGKYECGPGKWSSAGATSSSSCGNINCGYYGTNACSATPSGQKCASNKYSTAGSSSCSSCSSGQQPNSTQCSCETQGETKYSCDAGTYLKKNSTTCSQCPCGYYCPGGEWSKSTTEDQGKYECGPGKWSSAGATSSSSCGNINCGYYGTNACSATPSGQKCASNKYSEAGSSSCNSCPSGKVPNSTQCSCRSEEHGECDYTEPYYGCGEGNTLNKVDTTSSTEWQWYCKGADDTGDGAYCHKGCPSGQTLSWNGLHNGTCVAAPEKVNGRCSTQTINGCLAGQLGAYSSSNYVYTWTCDGLNGGTPDENCTIDCNVKCGDRWNTCVNDRGRSTVGTNQQLISINDNFAGHWGWKCNTSDGTRPTGCTAATSNFVYGGYSVGPNECGCDTYQCSHYASYGYHEDRYGGESYQQWPIEVSLPSGCFENEGGNTNGGSIGCYRAERYLGGTIVGASNAAEGLGYGEDIYGNKNVVCGCEFTPSSWGKYVEDITSFTVNYCARGKSVSYNGTTANPCKDPVSAGCAGSAQLKHNSTYGKTLSVDVNTSPYEPSHVVTVTLGTADCCETYKCTQSGGPTNSHYINTDVDICSQSNCDWECDPGYVKEGNKCVFDAKCGSADGTVSYNPPSTNSEKCTRGTPGTIQLITNGWQRRCTNPNNSSQYTTCSAIKCDGTIVPLSEVQHYQDDLNYSCSCGSNGCCCDAPICNRAITVFMQSTPCYGAELIDFVGSDGNSYAIWSDGGCRFGDGIIYDKDSCRFIIESIPSNVQSGYLRFRRKDYVNGSWVQCEDTSINVSPTINFSASCDEELNVDI